MRVNARDLERLRERLDPTDWEVLATVLRVGLISAGQLRRLFWPGPEAARSARRRLAHLAEWRVIGRLDRRVGGVRAGSDGFVYRVDVAGRRLLGLPGERAPHTPGVTFLAHGLAVTDTYVQAAEAARSGRLELLAWEGEPTCWRTWGAGVLKPDASLVVAVDEFEDHYFIEVDRATESSTTVARKAAAFDRYYATGIEQQRLGLFPQVLWLVPTARRRDQVIDALARRPAEHWRLHQVRLQDELLDHLLFNGKDKEL
ncbi:replication-relaxation family protein [soil metagenome]